MHEKRKVGYEDPSNGAVEESAVSSDEGEWIQLDMKLIDWGYMDFSRTVRVDTTIHTIKEVIKTFHGGRLASLTVCKDSYQETNELRFDKLTLKECGFNGTPNKSEAPVSTLHYDFTPDGCTDPDPILMC
mmetsp:Transcript_10498/g.22237  ORF Transcript_10498/g.22237 Transcript_10498/m.22237 type:complete len:130 (-) Transcript_10498:428-817(-)